MEYDIPTGLPVGRDLRNTYNKTSDGKVALLLAQWLRFTDIDMKVQLPYRPHPLNVRYYYNYNTRLLEQSTFCIEPPVVPNDDVLFEWSDETKRWRINRAQKSTIQSQLAAYADTRGILGNDLPDDHSSAMLHPLHDPHPDETPKEILMGSHRQVHNSRAVYHYDSPKNDEWCQPSCIGRVAAWFEQLRTSEKPNCVKTFINAVLAEAGTPLYDIKIPEIPTADAFAICNQAANKVTRRVERRFIELDPRPYVIGCAVSEPITITFAEKKEIPTIHDTEITDGPATNNMSNQLIGTSNVQTNDQNKNEISSSSSSSKAIE